MIRRTEAVGGGVLTTGLQVCHLGPVASHGTNSILIRLANQGSSDLASGEIRFPPQMRRSRMKPRDSLWTISHSQNTRLLHVRITKLVLARMWVHPASVGTGHGRMPHPRLHGLTHTRRTIGTIIRPYSPEEEAHQARGCFLHCLPRVTVISTGIKTDRCLVARLSFRLFSSQWW